jgi:putative flippase GtrA
VSAQPVVRPPRAAPRGELGRLVRFACVGGLNTGVTAVAFAALVALGLPGPAASALGFCLGALDGWWWNGRWTFAARRGRPGRYAGVQLLGAGLSALGVALATRAGLPHDLAEGATIVPVTLVGYVLCSRLAFAAP